jgi:hypothetical protein
MIGSELSGRYITLIGAALVVVSIISIAIESIREKSL